MAEPTNYDKLQDGRLDSLESLITAEYQPPQGAEYSFPVASQGITQHQYTQMNLGTGNGILHRYPETYYIETHPTDAETNARNTLLLKVTRHDVEGAVAEASIEGFYHRLTETIEIPIPAVTTSTQFYVTITYDPRKFKTNPAKIEVWQNSLPTQSGLKHIILGRVDRAPNQVLTQAYIRRMRQYASPVISVPYETTLPPAEDFLHGTIAAIGAQGRGGLYTNYSPTGEWENLLVGDWENCSIYATSPYSWGGSASARRRSGGIDVVADISNEGGSSLATREMFSLPEGMGLRRTMYATIYTTGGLMGFRIGHANSGRDGSLMTASSRPGYARFSLFIPDYYL